MNRASHEILFNYVSFCATALSGLLVNVGIFSLYGSEELGVFNQAFAFYVLSSQLAVLGIHYSTLHKIASLEEKEDQNKVMCAGAIGVVFVSLMVSSLLWQLSHYIAGILGSPGVVIGLKIVAVAVLLFSLNKLLLAVVNGLSRLLAFAAFQLLRALLLLFTFLVFVILEVDPKLFPIILCVSELGLLIGLVVYIRGIFGSLGVTLDFSLICAHLLYGAKGFMSGFFVQANMRIDILVLGYYLSDDEVGRYSLVALVAEGLFQIIVVMRNWINPKLVKMILAPDFRELALFSRRIFSWMYPGVATTCIAVGAISYGFISIKFGPHFGHEFLILYGILSFSIVCVAGPLAFDQLLLQANCPGLHTSVVAAVFVWNFTLNLILIPLLGKEGAAFATATSIVLAPLLVALVFRIHCGVWYFREEDSQHALL